MCPLHLIIINIQSQDFSSRNYFEGLAVYFQRVVSRLLPCKTDPDLFTFTFVELEVIGQRLSGKTVYNSLNVTWLAVLLHL